MDSDRRQKIQAILQSAVRLSDDLRATYLDRECAGDAGLRLEVEALLSSEKSTKVLVKAVAANGEPAVGREQEFAGSERFVVQRKLGSGGFGVVYQVYDRYRDAVLALKTMQRAEAGPLLRFKNEFRVLANIAHPNLVALYELLSEEGRWFFTMELVDGVDFLSHARTMGDNFDGLRGALRQLADGVSAIHQYGKLHCDLKPSNVLVDRSGRVRILDFGLVTDATGPGRSGDTGGFGTPGYMSPEQAAGLPVSRATDWYSFGVMVYQALTGQRPFPAARPTPSDQPTVDTASVSRLRPDAPEDLCELAAALLQRNPVLRPTGQQVLRSLGMPAEEATRIAWYEDSALLGREGELAALRQALRQTGSGRRTTVFMHGPSGVGKTALARHFLNEVREMKSHLVLEGRCHERESAPYKALDPLVDNVNRCLGGVATAEREALLPADFGALTRLFPVLESLRGKPEPVEIANAAELRLRGFKALHRLLENLAERQPVVLLIDDLQWGDLDSAAFLLDLIGDPEPARLLFLACYRSEEAGSSPLLLQLLQARNLGTGGQRVDLPVKDLEFKAARDLAFSLLGRHSPAAPAAAETIARESGGNPFFLAELVKHWEEDEGATADGLTIDELVGRRVANLTEESRRLLEAIALAGQPIELAIAKDAARLEKGAYVELAQLLRHRLVRTRRTETAEEIEAYHDRIRQGTENSLSAQGKRECHYRLAAAWESSGRSDPRFLATHFRGAEANDKALAYSIRAAEEAAAALAFDNAAQFYRFAVELAPESHGDTWRVKLGEALCNAGRGAEGARIYADVAARSTGIEAIDLRRRAAAHFLMAGRMEDGLALTREVLKVVRMKMPRWAWQALLSFFFWRLWIRARGMNFRERRADEIPAADLMRIDVCASLVQGLAMVDPIRAHPFYARGLWLSLRSGELSRIAKAFCTEAAYFALRGGRAGNRMDRLLDSAQDLADRSASANAAGLVAVARGMSAFLRGEWRKAAERMEAAEIVLRERCTGVAWEVATAHLMGSVSLFLMGELKQLKRRLPRIIKDAETRGDLFEATDLRTRLAHTICLAADNAAQAREEIRSAMDEWGRQDFDLQHWWAWLGNIETDLYAGDARAAWARVGAEWSRLRWSMLTRVQYVYVESLHHHARAALAVAAETPGGPKRRKLLERAQRDARKMEVENRPWSIALAKLVRAGVCACRGSHEQTVQLLDSAERELAACDMFLYAFAARYTRGRLVGGPHGEELSAEAEQWMRDQEIVNPHRIAAMLAPGV